jgi:hypothetical protein
VTGSKLKKVQLYIYLINFPILVMVLTGVIQNGNLLVLDIALNLDEIYILILSGYICYLEESRHTPIRGFVFLKDLFFILVFLAQHMILNTSSDNSMAYIIIVIILYLANLAVQSFTNELESWVLLALGFKEKNVYSASFLLTEKSQPSNFLEIKDIISEHE